MFKLLALLWFIFVIQTFELLYNCISIYTFDPTNLPYIVRMAFHRLIWTQLCILKYMYSFVLTKIRFDDNTSRQHVALHWTMNYFHWTEVYVYSRHFVKLCNKGAKRKMNICFSFILFCTMIKANCVNGNV